MRSPGQALVELAVTLPLLLILAFGGAQFVRLAIARAGLDAATQAAAAAAARAPDSTTAGSAAAAAFAGVASGYRLGGSSSLTLDPGPFARGSTVIATGSADLDLGFSTVPALNPRWNLVSTASARVEDWRSRTPPP